MKNIHKMNHSFDYNCTEWFFDHPRHGTIPCALADRDISRGEELFLHYGYDPNNCPAWYRLAVEDFLSQHPDLDIGQVVDPNRLVSLQSKCTIQNKCHHMLRSDHRKLVNSKIILKW